MSDLNQFLNKDLSLGDVSHSNGMGAAAGGGGAGGLSIDRRRELLNQPRVVGAYSYSRLGRQGPAVRARTVNQAKTSAYDASSDTFVDNPRYSSRHAGGVASRRKPDSASVERRQHFIEPPTRKYDKFR